jgi:hypothetical protein
VGNTIMSLKTSEILVNRGLIGYFKPLNTLLNTIERAENIYGTDLVCMSTSAGLQGPYFAYVYLYG